MEAAQRFGDLLRRYRVAVGLTQEQLAERAALSVRGLSDIERGLHRAPHPGTVCRLADALELSVTDRAKLQSARQRRSLAGPPLVHGALPVALTSFVGREAELHELAALLRRTRLLTVTGVGGVGKTRIAIRLAQEALDEYADGARFVDLASVDDPSRLPEAVARSTGIPEQRGGPLLETLGGALASRHLLLLLDNCEHLVAAVARIADYLLRACPHVRIVVTSREPLAAEGELAWRLTPLTQAESVRLFADRAAAAEPRFSVTERTAIDVVEVCRRLDGLPLAIELAAARARVLSAAELRARLDDRFSVLVAGNRAAPSRQQTLRATLDWSYGLLDHAERLLFDRLSVFAGSFTLAAAEAVCANRTSLLHTLAGLVDKSLVAVERVTDDPDSRYRLLETLRVYGWEHLCAQGQAQRLQRCHAAWVFELVELAERGFHGPEERQWLRRLAQEHESLRSALAWTISTGDAETALRLVGGLGWYYGLLGAWTESRDWLERALIMPGASAPTLARARALAMAGRLAAFQGDVVAARRWLDAAASVAQQLGDETVIVAAGGIDLQLMYFAGASDAAARLADDLLARSRRLADRWWEARWWEGRMLAVKGAAELARGDYTRATQWLEDAADLARATEDKWSLAMNLTQLGDVARASGAYDRAGDLYAESLSLHDELGLVGTATPSLLHNLAHVALADGNTQHAAERFGEAIVQFRRLGDRRGVAEAVIGLGAVAASEGRAESAARLLGAGQAALEALGTQLWPSNRAAYERSLHAARAALDPLAFEAAWAAGTRLSLEQAVTQP